MAGRYKIVMHIDRRDVEKLLQLIDGDYEAANAWPPHIDDTVDSILPFRTKLIKASGSASGVPSNPEIAVSSNREELDHLKDYLNRLHDESPVRKIELMGPLFAERVAIAYRQCSGDKGIVTKVGEYPKFWRFRTSTAVQGSERNSIVDVKHSVYRAHPVRPRPEMREKITKST